MSVDYDANDPFAPGSDEQIVQGYAKDKAYCRATNSNRTHHGVKFEGRTISVTTRHYGCVQYLKSEFPQYYVSTDDVLRDAIIHLAQLRREQAKSPSPGFTAAVDRAQAQADHEWLLNHLAYHEQTLANIEQEYQVAKSAEVMMEVDARVEQMISTLEYPEFIAKAERIRRNNRPC